MTQLCGWAPCGQELVAKVFEGRWQAMTFFATLWCDRIEARGVIDGPVSACRSAKAICSSVNRDFFIESGSLATLLVLPENLLQCWRRKLGRRQGSRCRMSPRLRLRARTRFSPISQAPTDCPPRRIKEIT